MRPFPTWILMMGVTLSVVLTSVGCRTNSEGDGVISESSFAVPNFSGIPEQWEPEVTQSVDSPEDEADLGL